MTELNAPDPATAAGTRIPIDLKLAHRATVVVKRASLTVQLVEHIPAVFTVLTAGVSALQTERDGGGQMLAAAELLVGAWVLIVIGQEARHLFGRGPADDHSASHAPEEIPRIDMPSLAAAALGYVEAWHHARTVGHFKLLSPYFIGATITLLFALGARRALGRRMQRVRPREMYIEVTPAGMRYRTGPRTSWRAAWTDVAAIENTRDEIVVRLHNGRRRVLRADAFFDGDELLANVRAAIAAHAPSLPTEPRTGDPEGITA